MCVLLLFVEKFIKQKKEKTKNTEIQEKKKKKKQKRFTTHFIIIFLFPFPFVFHSHTLSLTVLISRITADTTSTIQTADASRRICTATPISLFFFFRCNDSYR